jgi:hypothetical protein
MRRIGDLALIAFYYLLHVGKYSVKGKCNNTKQSVQFKFKDVSFLQREQGRDPRVPSLGRTPQSHNDG